jgi:site-specific recombinase XerD
LAIKNVLKLLLFEQIIEYNNLCEAPANYMITINQAIHRYIENTKLARSSNTTATYSFAMNAFEACLKDNGVDPAETAITGLDEDAIGWLALRLKGHAPATEALYLQATVGFYEFIAAEKLHSPNLPRLRLLVRQRGRRTGQRLPQFPREDIDRVLQYVQSLSSAQAPKDENQHLRNLRDTAFLLSLADTGLRVHEACTLRRGDIDWNEGRAVIIGKGDKQAVVRFSSRSLAALKTYLAARAPLDGASGKPLSSLPLFARHDKGAGKKVKPITTATGRNIVDERVKQALGDSAEGKITPHSFRHYFVTTGLRASGNLKRAQELSRHSNIAVTQRYAHISNDELDKGYHEIFEDPE